MRGRKRIGMFVVAAALLMTGCQGGPTQQNTGNETTEGQETGVDVTDEATTGEPEELETEPQAGRSSEAEPAATVSQAFSQLETGGAAGGTDEKPGENLSPTAAAIVGREKTDGRGLAGIPIDADKAESVSIYYGSVCYSFYSEERELIDRIASLFTGFDLEETPDGQLDLDTTYQVYFSTAESQIAAVNIDENGVFYLPEEKKYYRVAAGVFHLETLENIYRDSMNEDEFDPEQCFIR